MANHRKRVSNANTSRRQAYIEGNTVRRFNTAPARRETTQPEQQPKRTSRQVRKNRNREMHMSAGYVVFLTIAAVVGLVVCIQFLQLRSQVASQADSITAKQQELVELKDENNTKYNNIMDSVSLDEVRDRAVNQLGMVYAQNGQIIEYQNPESDYVKQYEEIPENGVLAMSGAVSD